MTNPNPKTHKKRNRGNCWPWGRHPRHNGKHNQPVPFSIAFPCKVFTFWPRMVEFFRCCFEAAGNEKVPQICDWNYHGNFRGFSPANANLRGIIKGVWSPSLPLKKASLRPAISCRGVKYPLDCHQMRGCIEITQLNHLKTCHPTYHSHTWIFLKNCWMGHGWLIRGA